MEHAPLIEHQRELERLFDKNQTVTRIRKEFTNHQDGALLAYMESWNIDPDFGIDLLTQMVLHKRCELPTLVGILRRHYDGAANQSQETADAIKLCAEADLVDWDPVTEKFIVRIDVSQDVRDDLDRFQYPLPMVIRPRHITANDQTGYITGRGSLILKKNHHDDDICLDHINRLNAIRFTLDVDTAHMIRNAWRNLDRPKAGETDKDFDRRKRAFEKYDRTAKDVMDLVTMHGNVFHLTHRYDKRGRTYCQGYHVNYQGAPWNKAVIELAEKELIV